MQEFRRAQPEDEKKILALYQTVKAKGKEDGTSDWDEEYPNKEILKDDMENKRIFVLLEKDTSLLQFQCLRKMNRIYKN